MEAETLPNNQMLLSSESGIGLLQFVLGLIQGLGTTCIDFFGGKHGANHQIFGFCFGAVSEVPHFWVPIILLLVI